MLLQQEYLEKKNAFGIVAQKLSYPSLSSLIDMNNNLKTRGKQDKEDSIHF